MLSLLSDSDSDEDTGSDSDSDSDRPGKFKYCASEECEVTKIIGVPPHQVPVTYKGYCKHCKPSQDPDSFCVSSECDQPCNAGEED